MKMFAAMKFLFGEWTVIGEVTENRDWAVNAMESEFDRQMEDAIDRWDANVDVEEGFGDDSKADITIRWSKQPEMIWVALTVAEINVPDIEDV